MRVEHTLVARKQTRLNECSMAASICPNPAIVKAKASDNPEIPSFSNPARFYDSAIGVLLSLLQQLQPGGAGVFHRGRSDVAPYESYALFVAVPRVPQRLHPMVLISLISRTFFCLSRRSVLESVTPDRSVELIARPYSVSVDLPVIRIFWRCKTSTSTCENIPRILWSECVVFDYSG
jgi:hypothetical protein